APAPAPAEVPAPPAPVPAYLNDIVGHVLKTRRYSLSTNNITVTTELTDLPMVLGHRGELEQVVVNLVVNAEHAMTSGHGSRILTIRTVATAGGCDLSIADTGSGIPRALLDQIFDPFFSTKPIGEGLGLGLSLVHRILSDHHGEIHVDSHVGVGTTFHIHLPSAPGGAGGAEAVAKQEIHAPAVRPLRILVVDDEDSVRSVIARMLKLRGHEIHEAADGGRALEMLLSPEHPYDVIVCDLQMPGLGGEQLLERLRADGSMMTNRLVFLTGDTSSVAWRRVQDHGEIPVLAKPGGLAQIARIVEELAEKPIHPM
ncbi:MAG: ATP-binding protein, partial [bacterium]